MANELIQPVQTKTVEQIRQEIADKQKQIAVGNLQSAIEKQRQSLQTEKQNLAPVFQDQRRQIGVEDTMARQAAVNMRAQQGLSGSGAMGQDVIAQNVTQGNRLGGIAQTEGKAYADIGMRQQTAESDFQSAVANANNQADMDNALEQYKLAREAEQRKREDTLRSDEIARQNQLRLEDATRQNQLRAEDYARQNAITAEERAYNDRLRQEGYLRQDATNLSDRTYNEKIRADELARGVQNQTLQSQMSNIGAYSNDFQAKINELMASEPNSPLIPALQAARQEKIADQTGAQQKSELANIGAYSNDFQAEINRRQSTADTADDWLIPYLQSARQEKVAGQQQAAETERLRLAKEQATLNLKLTPTPKTTAPKTTKPTAQPLW